MSSIDNSFAFSKKDNRTKVVFTYQGGEKNVDLNYSMRGQHVYTEPSIIHKAPYRVIQREPIRAGFQLPSNQPEQKKVGMYEIQGNPRIYRNYVQQKIKYN